MTATGRKTSSVHFLRFELSPDMIESLTSGASLEIGVSHPQYSFSTSRIPEAMRESLIADLN
jgi:hypothetical protein